MTLVDSTFYYGSAPTKASWQAIDDVRDVYGIYGLSFNDESHTIRVEYDASRLTEGDIAALLRDAGIDLCGKTWDA